MEKPIFRSAAVKIERKCRSETANLWKSRQRWNAEEELHIFESPDRTRVESGTSDLCQSRQSGSAEAELYIFRSQGRPDVQKRNETADVELQIFGSKDKAHAELQILGSRGRAKVWKRNIRSLAAKAEQKYGSGISDLSRQDREGVRKQHCRSLTVQSSWTCGSRSWHLWQAHTLLIVTANVEK